ncbi:Argonaute-binding protein [Lachnellula suecica]|uniref:Argonaute-binding protein n=1 Tax=Lachnellula suecica TaxID=602035 RepID=A0A8T9BX09_9HELO|nr:Argonaute-binding protein [Lachnellula suecica]
MSAPRAEDISRAISDLDLNGLRERSGNVPGRAENGLRYTKEELLSIRSTGKVEPDGDTPAGFTTPPDLPLPNAPPPTPASPPDGSALVPNGPNGELNGGLNGAVGAVGENGVPAKKKKKKSSGINKKLKVNPTGFEEFYADPPTTPEEHEAESDLYDPRIQTCVQRYRARRKLDSIRANIFSKYLILGGIEATVKAFTGGALDKETLESSTAEEIAAVQATDFIRTGTKNAKYYDPSDADKWVVDFEGVAKGFFSRTVPFRLGADTDEEIKMASAVIRNFLNYVLQHNVCPEYVEDVMAARRVCDLAEKDLMAIRKFRTKLPGDFNIAASTICGGRYQCEFISTQLWNSGEDPQQETVAAHVGMAQKQAEIIFQAGIAFKGSDYLFKLASKKGIHIVKTEAKAYEVVAVERASLTSIEEIAVVKNHLGVVNTIKALGVLKIRAWEGPGLDPEDFTDDEEPEMSIDESIESFWLEDDILQMIHPGLKLILVVHELNIGIKFFDQINGLYCSFHTYLENEKMHGWKEPAINDRAPPTEDDPDVEMRIENAIQEGELAEDEKTFGGK